jgi:hypothetical protein
MIYSASTTTPRIWFRATTHACIRLRGRAPALSTHDLEHLRNILVGMCYHGRVLPIEAWVIGQYFIEAVERRSRRNLILAMEREPNRPQVSVVRTVLCPNTFALWGRVA